MDLWTSLNFLTSIKVQSMSELPPAIIDKKSYFGYIDK